METNNVESLRAWFRECPEISKSAYFRTDFLAPDPTEYALFSVPSSLSYHENIMGEEELNDIQTQNFIFSSKEFYGADARQNMANLGFYQRVTAWILEKNNKKEFPEWDDGVIKSIVPTLTAYPAQVGSSAAKYQIQIRITYRRI